jgi:hypothetical protein
MASDAFDNALIAAAQLDDVTIRIADKDRYLPAFAEADGTLGGHYVVRLRWRSSPGWMIPGEPCGCIQGIYPARPSAMIASRYR